MAQTTAKPPEESVLAHLNDLLPDLEALYTDIHAHPELSMHETRTAGLAADRLRAAGYDVTTGIGKTDVVKNRGPVVTYGVNDMVLDNWGVVDRWIAEEKITSYGPSGIGFVNFGIMNELRVNALIETFGRGARGFNVYTGTVSLAEFDRIVTHADGAMGVQISRPVGRIIVGRGIETFGGTGESLVKGAVMTLSAIGLSVKPGGSVREIDTSGGLKTNGSGVPPIEQHGAIESLRIAGGCVAAGDGFDTI